MVPSHSRNFSQMNSDFAYKCFTTQCLLPISGYILVRLVFFFENIVNNEEQMLSKI